MNKKNIRNRMSKPQTPSVRPQPHECCDHHHEEKPKGKLTLKQRKWLSFYMESGNATDAALEAYGLDKEKQYHAARQIGWENMTKLDLQIEDLMGEAGITDVFLVRKLNENLDATKLYGKSSIEHGDFGARNKALEMAFKLKGKLTDKVDLTSKGKQLKGSVTVVKLPQNGRERTN